MSDRMLLLDYPSLPNYLRDRQAIGAQEPITVRTLNGGVSNAVFLIERSPPHLSFVIKQAREQLQVAEPWFCSVERIRREVAVLRRYGEVLSAAHESDAIQFQVPQILFEDPANYLYAMSAAPTEAITWKDALLQNHVQLPIAAAAGKMLGELHAQTWMQPILAVEFADQTFFESLRIDPYYRHVARQHAELEPALNDLIASLDRHRLVLVHGDYSPKNLLVAENSLTLLDFEVGHYGDPAFDIGFFFTHLVLKWLWSERSAHYQQNLSAAWEAYAACLQAKLEPHDWDALQTRGRQHLGGCLLARIAGKSKVDYLSTDQQHSAWQLGQQLLCGTVAGDFLAAIYSSSH